jgi:hypothetical protein
MRRHGQAEGKGQRQLQQGRVSKQHRARQQDRGHEHPAPTGISA